MCAQARGLGMNWGRDAGDATVRMWLEGQLQPWRIEAQEGQATGLLTGYFEPMVEARRKPQAPFLTPLHRPPADLGKRKPYLSRTDLETTPEGKAALAGRELVHVADPLDALLVQVQGSTRVKLLDELDAQGKVDAAREHDEILLQQDQLRRESEVRGHQRGWLHNGAKSASPLERWPRAQRMSSRETAQSGFDVAYGFRRSYSN